jgi:hypothetical protein
MKDDDARDRVDYPSEQAAKTLAWEALRDSALEMNALLEKMHERLLSTKPAK